MIVEDKEQGFEIELTEGMIEELTARADTMGLTAEEYAGCVLGQYIKGLGVGH